MVEIRTEIPEGFFEAMVAAARVVAQPLAEKGETMRRFAAALSVFDAHAEGKKVRCVTGTDGVTRVQSREKRPDELGFRLLVHTAPPFTTTSYESIDGTPRKAGWFR